MSSLSFRVVVALLALAGAASAGTFKVKKNSTIQATIDQAGPGDTVLVPKGTWFEILVVPESKPGLRLLGKGAVLDARPAGASGSGSAITVLANDVTVRGFTIRHARPGSPTVPGADDDGYGVRSFGERLHLQKLVIENVQRSGVRADGGDVLVEQVIVRRTKDKGICVGGARPIVRKCEVSGTEDQAIAVSGNEAVVENNRVTHCGQGVAVEGVGVTASKNRIDRVFQTALSLSGQAGSLLDNRVEGAEIGIEVSATLALVEGNVVRGTRVFGIVGGGGEVVVQKNHFTDGVCIEGGILLSAESLLIAKNTLRDLGGPGIRASGAAPRVEQNNLQRVGALNQRAAVEVTGDSARVSKNKLSDLGGPGIDLASADDALAEQNSVKGAVAWGLRVRNTSSQTSLVGNTIKDVVGEGIQNLAFGTVIQGNKVAKTRTPLTNASGGATLVDQGGNKLGKGVNAAGAPAPEILD